jgi:poly(3-hydroxybutyrate) depolymerase
MPSARSGTTAAIRPGRREEARTTSAIWLPYWTTWPPDTTIRTWHGPSPASDVSFYRIDGGGHTWPGSHLTLPAFLFGRTSRTFDATRLIWEFFATHAT